MPNHAHFEPGDFPNQLGLLTLTSDEIERQIASYTLSFPQLRDEEVEKRIKFPQFVRAFYNYIYKYSRVPTQAEFYNFYLIVSSTFFKANSFGKEIYDGLQARVFRTYPSLVRDFHFNKSLSEQLADFEIVYNSNLDIEHDIDTLLVKDGRYWAACLYTQTKRANIARGWKENRHERFENVNYIEFPVVLRNECKVGDFFLYGDKERDELLKRIKDLKIS